MKFNKIFFGCMAASAMALASCSSEEVVNLGSQDSDVYGTGSELVTLSVAPEYTPTASRADALYNISDGKKADALIFAVYCEQEDGQYVLAPEFKKSNEGVGQITPGKGQNVLNVTTYPHQIRLAIDPSKTYKVVFWAEYSGNASYYTTTDLTQVTVNYENVLNNDELRDAFCAVTDPITVQTSSQEVVMHRPFAQINVGTSGADYAQIVKGESYTPNKKLAYSKIVLKGVANKINVLTDEISEPTETIEATFKWNKFASYVNINVPTTDEGTVDANKLVAGVDNEQFLTVHLNGDDVEETEGHAAYKTEYPTRNEDGTYLTETFKYLSMCYVLVPAAPVQAPDSQEPYTSTVLENVKVYFAENPDGTDNMVDKDDEGKAQTIDAFAYLSIDNVPVHRNWRTNILGGLQNTPNDDPDDPTSLFNTVRVCVHLCPIYDGEYTGFKTFTEWIHTTFPGHTEDDDCWHDPFHGHESGEDGDLAD